MQNKSIENSRRENAKNKFICTTVTKNGEKEKKKQQNFRLEQQTIIIFLIKLIYL